MKQKEHHVPHRPHKTILRTKREGIAWRAPEHLYRKKTVAWYVLTSVFFGTFMIFFIALQSWYAAIIVALAFWVFLRYAEDKPQMVDYVLNDMGLAIADRKINFSELDSFELDESHDQPLILLNTTYMFAMPITLVVKEDVLDDVIEHLIEHLPPNHGWAPLRWLTHWLHY